MTERHLTAFLISFSLMFVLHYMLEPTWQVGEPRPKSLRLIANYIIGTLGICLGYLYLQPGVWLDLLIPVLGAGSATALAHGRDWLLTVVKRDRANGLVEELEEQP
jgi:hypothetical protein